MITCHCNTIAREAFEKALLCSLEDLAKKATLKQAVGHVWRQAVDGARDHRNPFSCTICFGDVAELIQAQGLFVGEKLPEQTHNCATCPRIAECGLSLKG